LTQRDRAFAALIFRHPEVAERLDAVEWFRNAKASLSSVQTAYAVGYLRSTLYGWDALCKGDPVSLVNDSRRCKTAPVGTVRMPELRATTQKLRKHFAWGIEQICTTLHQAGWKASETSVGRVVQEILASDKIKRISFAKVHKSKRKRKKQERYGECWISAKPTGAVELFKMDTVHMNTPSGEKLYFISAVDAHTRQTWFDVYTSPSATNATDLLRHIYEGTKPEQIKVDGSSEFRGCYEQVCKHFGLRLIVLPPNSLKLNRCIKSLNAMLARELLNLKGVSNNIRVNRENFKQFISDYHVVSPHEAFGLKTHSA